MAAAGVIGLLALLAPSGSVHAQPRAVARPAPAVVVPPQLVANLATKRKTDAQKVAASYRTDATGSFFRTKGREYRLIDANDKRMGKVSRNTLALPLRLAAAKDEIAQWTFGKVGAVTPVRADHRALQTPIRDQQQRGTCSAFAAVAGLEGVVKRRLAATSAAAAQGRPIAQVLVPQDLSENHAFNRALQIHGAACSNTGVHTWASTDAALGGLCAEGAFPYTPFSCPPAGVPAPCASGATTKLNNVFSMATPRYSVPDVPLDMAHRADNIALLEAFLNDGIDIIYAVDVAGSDWADAATRTVDVTTDANGAPDAATGGHAMLMVGYDRPNKYFIFKNSWGSDFGREGYVYISYDYIQLYAWYGFATLD